MEIIKFINSTDLNNKNEITRSKLLCFYHYKETGEKRFSMSLISNLLIQSGFNAPNTSRLKQRLVKGRDKAFIESKNGTPTLEFIPVILQSMDKDIGNLWEDSVTIVSNSALIDEEKFCNKRNYLDKLIYQINHSYENNCYDATAVLMRRLFEVLLVLSYQNMGIDNEIKDSSGKGYVMLESIVGNAKNNQTLKLSRIKNEFDSFRMVGNFSAHNITYTAGKKDIDNIKLNYRVMLEELYNKAGLII